MCLDELPEPDEVVADAALHDAQHVGGTFDQAFRLDVELEHHHRPIRAERLEPDPTVVASTVGAPPADDPVGLLLGDLGAPMFDHARDRGGPLERPVIDLDDPIDAGHEPGERFELGPLVVGDPNGHRDLDVLDDSRHGAPRVAASPRGPLPGTARCRKAATPTVFRWAPHRIELSADRWSNRLAGVRPCRDRSASAQ